MGHLMEMYGNVHKYSKNVFWIITCINKVSGLFAVSYVQSCLYLASALLTASYPSGPLLGVTRDA